jgi:hypothetical protein
MDECTGLSRHGTHRQRSRAAANHGIRQFSEIPGSEDEFATYRSPSFSPRSSILALTSLVLALSLLPPCSLVASQLAIPSNRPNLHQIGLVV